MNKTCLGLIVAIVMLNPVCLFAQHTITPTSQPTAKHDVTGDYADPSYMRFKDYTSQHGSTDTSTGTQPDPAFYYPIPTRSFPFKDYTPQHNPTPSLNENPSTQPVDMQRQTRSKRP